MDIPARRAETGKMSDIRRFVEVFKVAAIQAGAVARLLQGKIRAETKKGQSSPEAAALTPVDLAAQDVILLLLHDAFPEVAVDAEEDTETVSLFPAAESERPLVVIDPIDGTLNYIRGSDDYAVMGAWIEGGRYRAALVYFPVRREALWALRGGGCWRQIRDGRPQGVAIGNLPESVLVSPKVPKAWREVLQKSGLEVRLSRCSAEDASAPAAGFAAASLSPGRPERRRAIGFLLTLEAGGVVRLGNHKWTGEDPLSLSANRKPNVVAASSDLAARILKMLGKD